MILPIYALGQPVLKKVAVDIQPDYPDIEQLIANMWETMYNAQGVGLAAPQIGLSIRLFIIDTTEIGKDAPQHSGFKRAFINAHKVEERGTPWSYEEGCLSIPDIRGDVDRQPELVLRYMDEQFKEHVETFTGINARVIQHEYDHIDGILFTELLKPLKKQLIRRKLEYIKQGKISSDYRMKFLPRK